MLNKMSFFVFLVVLPAISTAQFISIKTVPVATGDQFSLFPSRNASMAGLSVVLEDPLLDPFINPAKGSLIEGMQFFASPVYYGISFKLTSAKSSGLSLPLGILLHSKNFFGGLVLARQELTISQRLSIQNVSGRLTFGGSNNVTTPNNNYTYIMAGRKLPGTDISIGASVFWADLNAIDGVQHLYFNSVDIKQSGSMAQYRLGAFAPLDEGRSAELLLMRHQFKMTHDVSSLVLSQSEFPHTTTERHLDETEGWAVRVGYREPLGKKWTLGLQLTGNWKSHPKIPNYSLMNIPRDPGNSSAYNLGIGFARHGEKGFSAVEYIYEPIWSHTWADANTIIPTATGKILQPGQKTVENHFRFSNSIFRVGFHGGIDRSGLDFGLQLHSITYQLNQYNFVEERHGNMKDSWNEWTITSGFTLTYSGFDIRYGGILTIGTGEPLVETASRNATDGSSPDLLIALRRPISVSDAWVLTHQVSLIVQLD